MKQPPVITNAVRISVGDRTLRTMMASHQASEEQILKVFAKGEQALMYFDRLWLQQNTTYQRLRAAGEL